MSLSVFWRATRHIPKRQLFRRLGLTLRRRLTMSAVGAIARRRQLQPIPIADSLPTAVFSSRSHLIQATDEGDFLCQLNRKWLIGPQVDWQLDKNQATHLERLAFHYLEFVEALPPQRDEAVICHWIDHNPPWQQGYWLDSWNSYAVSIRTVCMMQWVALHNDSVHEDAMRKITSSVAEQIRFLCRNLETDICGNHLLKNVKALLWAGNFFRGPEAIGWTRIGRKLLWQELKAQFLDDGMHFELSPAYHCQVFADLMDCAYVLSPENRLQLIAALQPAAQVIADLTHPDDQISLFSDGGLDMAYSPQECLTIYKRLGGDWPTSCQSFGYEEAGYFGIRSDTGYLLFDCGPSCADALPAHGHGDILAFEWDVGTQRVIVDAGVREYEPGAERDWNRSTRAHNTVTVGGRDQCEFIKSFRVGHRAHGRCLEVQLTDSHMSVTGEYTSTHNDGQKIRHCRTISGTPATFSVRDVLTSGRSEPAVARILLHHACRVTATSENSVLIDVGEDQVQLTSESKISICDSRWSPNFGEEYTTIQLEIDYGNTPCESGFRLNLKAK